MIVIRDALHGNIKLSDMEKELVDTREMQRLRRIKQLAMAYLVYPGANHTRFEHSLGTLHLTDDICSSLGIEGEEREKLRIASLLHDVGHTAFSHEGEEVTKKYFGSHEEIGKKKIEKGEIADILGDSYSPKEIMDILYSEMGRMITSDIGSDRMDYLLRDSLYTGVAYGMIDSDRIVHTLLLHRGKIVLHESGLEAAEALLIARFLMFSTVYFHHAVRIASSMLRVAMDAAIKRGEISADDLMSLGDVEMLNKLREIKASSSLADAIYNRRLYKKAFSIELTKLSPHARKIAKSGELERAVREKSGCNSIVDFPISFVNEMSAPVLKDGKAKPILDLSVLVRSLRESERQRVKLIVSCEGKNIKKVASAASGILSKCG